MRSEWTRRLQRDKRGKVRPSCCVLEAGGCDQYATVRRFHLAWEALFQGCLPGDQDATHERRVVQIAIVDLPIGWEDAQARLTNHTPALALLDRDLANAMDRIFWRREAGARE